MMPVMSSHIYTRKGDRGHTGLADGSRLPKDAIRVEAYGAVDEANSWAARAAATDPLLSRCLEFVQHRLYNCSSNLAMPAGSNVPPPGLEAEDLEFLERAIDRFERTSGPISCFVLPGGTPEAGMLHVARTMVRRAERRVVTLCEAETIDMAVLRFLNRASDLLFAAARYANSVAGAGDVAWDKDLSRPDL